jgi:sulfate adenylyltransferase subunit 1
MDLIAFDQQRFEAIHRDYQQFAAPLGFASIAAIPISALNGDNIIEPSANTPWYAGPPLLNYLETVLVADDSREQPFRLPVQWVNRPHLDFRGFCGTIASGSIRPGDELRVSSSGRTSRVARIVTMGGDLAEAVAGQAVTLTLADEIDVSRGDMLSAPDTAPFHTRHLVTHLVWLHDEPLQPGQSYLVKTASAMIPGRVTSLQYVVDVNTLEHKQAATLGLNAIGVTRLELDRPAAFDPYRQNRHTGSFILIDRFTNATVAAGMVIAAAPELSPQGEPAEAKAKSSAEGAAVAGRINLGSTFISGDEGNLVDLSEMQGQIEFDVTPAFLDLLAKGNRVLFRLHDPGQLPSVALLAYEHGLQFTFRRDGDRVNLILFSPGPNTNGDGTEDVFL